MIVKSGHFEITRTFDEDDCYLCNQEPAGALKRKIQKNGMDLINGNKDDMALNELKANKSSSKNRRRVQNAGNFFRRKAVLPKKIIETSNQEETVTLKKKLPNDVENKDKLHRRKKMFDRAPAPIVNRLADRNPRSKIRMTVIGEA